MHLFQSHLVAKVLRTTSRKWRQTLMTQWDILLPRLDWNHGMSLFLSYVSPVKLYTVLHKTNKVSSFAVVVCAVVGLCGWCLWRFFKKKRPKDGKGKKKDGLNEGVSNKITTPCDLTLVNERQFTCSVTSLFSKKNSFQSVSSNLYLISKSQRREVNLFFEENRNVTEQPKSNFVTTAHWSSHF